MDRLLLLLLLLLANSLHALPVPWPRHRIGVDRLLLRRARHVLLVRDPAAVIGSFAEVLEPTLTVRRVVYLVGKGQALPCVVALQG